MKRKLKIGVVADPIKKFDPVAETTSFILHEAFLRGHELWMMELGDIFIRDDAVFALSKNVAISKNGDKFTYQIISSKTLPLDSFDILFLRKDPPVTMAYINHLTILELLASHPSPFGERVGVRGSGPLLINSPSGIKWANEKILPLHFPGLSPPTVVSSSRDVLEDFLHQHKKCVLKPLNSGGGRGVVLIRRGKDLKNSTEQVLLQKYLPEAKKGDKRVLLLDGKILGYFLRVPKKGDFRANLHQGGRFVRTTLSSHEKKLIKRVVPSLKTAGLYFVGIDIIGNYVTEINVTSPMGVREVNDLYGYHLERKIMDWAVYRTFE